MYLEYKRKITVEYQGKFYKFKDCQDSLYYYDTAYDTSISDTKYKYNYPITPYLFLRTAKDSKPYFNSNEIEGDNNAIRVQHING